MKILVVGASGATGKLLVDKLLEVGHKVEIVIRDSATIPESWKDGDKMSIIRANIADISVEEMTAHLADCQAVACCLGHSLTLKGVFGKPRKLVTDAVRLLCTAINNNTSEKPVKFVLMNTVGNTNRDIKEPISFLQKIVIGLIRLTIPPQSDNEKAADYLRLNIGQKSPVIEWAVVRPDSLINQDEVTNYSLYPSPIRSAIFNPGKTSRINVAHLMAKLITDTDFWNKWKGQMPVIYNAGE